VYSIVPEAILVFLAIMDAIPRNTDKMSTGNDKIPGNIPNNFAAKMSLF
jgi:hypothetical protein